KIELSEEENKKLYVLVNGCFLISAVSFLSTFSHFLFSAFPSFFPPSHPSTHTYLSQDMAFETEYQTEEVATSRVASELIDTTFKSSTIGKYQVVHVPRCRRHKG